MDTFKKSPVTYALLIVTSLVFMAMQLFYPGQASTGYVGLQFGGMYGELVKANPAELWRLISPVFVHFGWSHFIFNMITLYYLGTIVETIWGSRNFLLLYFLSGIMGNATTLWLTPDVVAGGASTSLFGMFAAVVIVGYFGKNPYLKELGRSYQALIIVNLVFNLVTPSVSIVGHLGGLVGGALLASFLPLAQGQTLLPKSWRTLALVAYIGLLLVCLGFGLA